MVTLRAGTRGSREPLDVDGETQGPLLGGPLTHHLKPGWPGLGELALRDLAMVHPCGLPFHVLMHCHTCVQMAPTPLDDPEEAASKEKAGYISGEKSPVATTGGSFFNELTHSRGETKGGFWAQTLSLNTQASNPFLKNSFY